MMIKKIGKIAERLIGKKEKTPNALYDEERHLVNQPFYFEGTNGKAVLLVHGWTAVPYELRRLGVYLNENGYTVQGLLLSGHGTKPEDLEGICWKDWLNDVEAAYDNLRKNHDKAYVSGTSIGAVLATILASKKKDVSALVLMAMPYRLRFGRFLFFVLKAIAPFKKYARKIYYPALGFSKNITRRISYQTYPIESILEVFKMVGYARTKLADVEEPCLIMQSEGDNVVEGNSAEEIYRHIGSKIKSKKYVKHAYHTFISDIKNEHVFEDILKFIEEN